MGPLRKCAPTENIQKYLYLHTLAWTGLEPPIIYWYFDRKMGNACNNILVRTRPKILCIKQKIKRKKEKALVQFLKPKLVIGNQLIGAQIQFWNGIWWQKCIRAGTLFRCFYAVLLSTSTDSLALWCKSPVFLSLLVFQVCHTWVAQMTNIPLISESVSPQHQMLLAVWPLGFVMMVTGVSVVQYNLKRGKPVGPVLFCCVWANLHVR